MTAANQLDRDVALNAGKRGEASGGMANGASGIKPLSHSDKTVRAFGRKIIPIVNPAFDQKNSMRTSTVRAAVPVELPKAPPTHQQRTQRIRQEVTQAAVAMRQAHPWLAHQNAIGLAIQLGSIIGMVTCAVLYLQGTMPWWVTVPLVALLASFTHEIEHDLIHQMYFKGQPWVQNVLLLLGWIARPTTINPWFRRELHFHHHKQSGLRSDMEERSITNGEPWGLKRLLMIGDGMLAIVLRVRTTVRISGIYIRDVQKPKTPRALRRAILQKLLAYVPLGSACWATWHAFVLFHSADIIARLAGHPIDWSPTVLSAMSWVNALTVCLVGPNVLRSFCLHFISSNMHYYGDVEAGNVIEQCQVLDHPVFLPLQLFCFNFGSTHAIHHFVVGQPFYLRQMIAKEAHEVMRREGVRFNDLGTFKRANRLGAFKPAAA